MDEGLSVRKFLTLALMQLAWLAGCGGGGYGATSTPPPPTTGSNVEPITIDLGPAASSINTAFISVQICAPGSTTNCQTIDHVEVDTGSTGLRIIASTLSASLLSALPQEMDSSNHPFGECLPFADGSSWGSLRVADMKLPNSGKAVAGLTVQIIGDPAYPTVPSGCPGPPENTVGQFNANGILGVGPFLQDCGGFCTTGIPTTPLYYDCPTASTCTATTASVTQQVNDPVSLFAADNNGVLIQLGSVAAGGTTTASGNLIFGIATQSNNALGSATVLPINPSNGFINAMLNGTQYTDSYLDSGSNGFFFNTALTACASPDQVFYCPTSAVNESATLQGETTTMLIGPTATADFTVANATTMFSNATYSAFPQLGGTNAPDPASLDLGLPFFYGRSVFTAFEGQMVAGTMGPFFAY